MESAAAPSGGVADQLAEVVLCVNHLVESLELAEEKAELAFFQNERDAIEREFESRLDELRSLLARADLDQAAQATEEARQQPPGQAQKQTLRPSHYQHDDQSPPQQSRHLRVNGHAQPPPAVVPAPVPAYAPRAASPSIPAVQFALPPLSAVAAVPTNSNITAAAAVPSVLLVCGPDHSAGEVWCTHAELAECSSHNGHTTRYMLPNVAPHAVQLLLQCVRRRGAGETDGTWLRTTEIVASPDLGFVLDACNVLGLPWLFVLMCARVCSERPGDLAFLHQLVSDSFFARLDADAVLRLQDHLLHQRPEHVDQVKAVLNMFWYLQVAAAFPNYKAHLKRRTQALSGMGEAPHHCDWLEPPAAVSVVDGTGKSVPAALAILWVRVYLELLFASLAMSVGCSPPGVSLTAATSHARALWSSVGFLVHFLHITPPPSSSNGVDSRALAHSLVTLCKETIHLRGLCLDGLLLEPQGLLHLVATSSLQLRVLILRLPLSTPYATTAPALTAASLLQLQLPQRFPKLRVVMEQ